ncbi:MAG: NAD(P)H-dependent oxidoreductase [bacterium]|nr:NAD(P)H-dependent oxidoreductase [bacterium]
MKILVVFYSRTGFTKKVCLELAVKLQAEVEEIIDTKSRKGPIGWLCAGRDATRKTSTLIAQTQKNLADYDLVVLGTPVWAWTLTPALRTYLTQQKSKVKNYACFCTMGGSGDQGLFSQVEDILGQKPLATLTIRTKQAAGNQYAAELDRFAEQIAKS